MIEETMLHGRMAGRGRQPCAERHRRRMVRPAPISSGFGLPVRVSESFERHPRGVRIDWDTILIPRAVAEGVCEEVQVWVRTALPRRWMWELVGRANTVYAHNRQFRQRIRGPGEQGRDYLWMFMRHWLAAMLKRRRYDLFIMLPTAYAQGRALPKRVVHYPNPAGSDE